MSSSFHDRLGRCWTLELTYGAQKKIRAAFGIDFRNFELAALGPVLQDDTQLLVLLHLASMESQPGVDCQAFIDSMNAQTTAAGLAALMEELVDSSAPQLQPVFRRLLDLVNL